MSESRIESDKPPSYPIPISRAENLIDKKVEPIRVLCVSVCEEHKVIL